MRQSLMNLMIGTGALLILLIHAAHSASLHGTASLARQQRPAVPDLLYDDVIRADDPATRRAENLVFESTLTGAEPYERLRRSYRWGSQGRDFGGAAVKRMLMVPDIPQCLRYCQTCPSCQPRCCFYRT
ncbi:PREDICTED: uncharacterized protein LOC106810098 [Priapulus caudatus]|uniref:Uncharacterized protein LOC106810098 n=1 Tax=Priapulus caudatus TaxID=37621 RepID=A0ABM1E9I6_PRICU|nr:PREDICTED: uncharacterized protein LOC106810098 [Priapulus caudatus]XP_014668857.1 PREDICTED: uncharacterized protein LOC106810098 [Priapulus caudatus]